MSSADDQYEVRNDAATGGAPAGDATDNSYTSRTGQSQIPVQKDQAPVEDPIDPATADSDETLARDDAEAIDQSNILNGGRTRGAKPTGTYREPGDEEGLPANDGTSST
ncbi:hypothetical protein LPUS_10345 [Lasallia pustulata]|uniref:Histone chaperone domain-containing protein n=1 Tax=Lasallia pustulata TaxID=136370 RepID=A0A1W5D9M8_9LECA|nr:hypothetical protein LPUS_10345 [Lasallia pustulata]